MDICIIKGFEKKVFEDTTTGLFILEGMRLFAWSIGY